jgi:hypothetical protein
MAARNLSPKPAEPKPAKRPRQQRRPEYQSVTAVNYGKTEQDVTKLIDCLAEWERDLRAARYAAPQMPPRRSRSRSDSARRISTAPPTPRYPRGNPLTDWMEFTDGDGAVWLAYIESAQPAPGKQRGSGTVLPDRHLRFDSATESRFTSLVPAGSPFLTETRLQSLLDGARPDLPSAVTTASPARALSRPGYRVIEWSTHAVESGRQAIAGWSRGLQQTASRMEARSRHVLTLLSGVANTRHGMVRVLLGHRPARP